MAVSATAMCGQAAHCGIFALPPSCSPQAKADRCPASTAYPRHLKFKVVNDAAGTVDADSPKAPSEAVRLSEERVKEAETNDPEGSSQQELWIRRLRLLPGGGPPLPERVGAALLVDEDTYERRWDHQAADAEADSDADAAGAGARLDDNALRNHADEQATDQDMWIHRLQLYCASTDPGPSSCNTSRAASQLSHLSHLTSFRGDGEDLKSTLTSLLSKTLPPIADALYESEGPSSPEPSPGRPTWSAAAVTAVAAAAVLAAILLPLGARVFLSGAGAAATSLAEISWNPSSSILEDLGALGLDDGYLSGGGSGCSEVSLPGKAFETMSLRESVGAQGPAR